MRHFLLILISLLCQNTHGQILSGMARMEGFNPYRPVTGRLEFSPDPLNPQTVREFDSTGLCVRHAEVKMTDGRWYLDGQDTLWGFQSVSVFTVKENIPDGPFHYTYKENMVEEWLHETYSGEYKDGYIHGKLIGQNGTYFHYEKGRLNGTYMYHDYRQGMQEKGRFKNGYREGKVVISNNSTKIKTLLYTNGYLQSVEFHHKKNIEKYHDYRFPEYSHFVVLSDTLANTLEVMKYGREGDTAEIQQHFGAADIRSNKIYESYEFRWEYSYSLRDKPQRLRIENYLISNEHPVGTYAKQIRSFYADGSSDDSLYKLNSMVLEYYRDRKHNYFYYNEEGALSEVRYSYQTYHNPITCLYGLKDLWGEWVLQPEYEEINWGSHLGFIVKKDGRYGLYSWDGKELITPELEDLLNLDPYGSDIPIETFPSSFDLQFPGIFRARKNGKWGIIDQKGIWLIPAAYDEINAKDIFVTASKGYDHFLWKLDQGKYLPFDQSFEEIAFYQIPFLIKAGQKRGLLGRDFKWIIPPEYDQIEYVWGAYLCTKRIGDKQFHFWVLNPQGQKINEEPFLSRPILHEDFIEPTGPGFTRGIMTYQGKLLANAEYSLVNNYAFKTNKEKCSTLVYQGVKEGKHYLIDTNGTRSGAFGSLLLIAPYAEYATNWGTIYSECPQVLSFMFRNENQYGIINQQGGAQLNSGILGEKIDSMWVTGMIAYVSTPKHLYFYFSHDGRVFNQAPNAVAKLNYSGITRHNDECIIRFQNDRYGLIDNWSGEWLLKAEYQSIEKRGEDYVLRDENGQLSFYRRGSDNTWQKKYSLRFPVNAETYIVYSHSRNAGVMWTGGQLLVDTLYQSIAFQTSFRSTWYWAEKKGSGIWDVYASDGKKIYSDIRAASGCVLDNGGLMITTKEGKMVLLNPQKEELIRADRILSQDHNMNDLLFKEGGVWGRYNGSGQFSHPARYEKIWPFRPFYVMDKGIPGQIDSDGNLVARLTTSSFLTTPLPWPGHHYFSFCMSNNYENPDKTNCSLDSLKTWQSNLLFMLRSNNQDISNYAAEKSSAFGFTQVFSSGERKEIQPSVHFLDYDNKGNHYINNDFVSYFSENLISTFFITDNMSYRVFRQVETHTYSYKDSVLKKLKMADIVDDEKTLELLLLKGLAEKNLPVEVCPDLKLVYALNKDRFFVDENGITFLIEVSYQEVYLPVKIPFAAMIDNLRKDSPIHKIAISQ